jgi:hypothetical protein
MARFLGYLSWGVECLQRGGLVIFEVEGKGSWNGSKSSFGEERGDFQYELAPDDYAPLWVLDDLSNDCRLSASLIVKRFDQFFSLGRVKGDEEPS